MRSFVAADKHVNEIRTFSRQPPITTTEELLEVVLSVGSAPILYSENPKPTESSVTGYSPDSNDVRAGS
jgi:hypothetical protein